ncbi:hypothetical protein BaRGS_00019944 [Batillaria attramentaria]|uniref:Secreted protein n=1 Tax=Batillaria attramentaria TaxID=370345 RepID=A0ABD0KP02_9CAEN
MTVLLLLNVASYTILPTPPPTQTTANNGDNFTTSTATTTLSSTMKTTDDSLHAPQFTSLPRLPLITAHPKCWIPGGLWHIQTVD